MSDPADNAGRDIERADEARRRAVAARSAAEAVAPVNTSGRCRECGDDIDPRRLENNPRVRLCVPCKNDDERLARQRRA